MQGENPPEKKPRGFALFSDDGKSFSFRRDVIQEKPEPIVPQVKTWEKICVDFLNNQEEITNFQEDESYSNDYSNKNRKGGRFQRLKPNVFIQKLRNSGKQDNNNEDNQEEKQLSVGRQIALQKEKEATQHQFLVLRKAALSEAKLQKKRAKM